MKYIFFCYNTLTICRSMKYAKDIYGMENSVIVYSNFVADIPSQIMIDFNVRYVESGLLNIRFHGLKLHLQNAMVTNKIWKIIENELSENEDNVLIVFRDNEVQETTFIERAVKMSNKNVCIWLMEEGAGLYAFKRPEIRFRSLKKIIYMLTGCSSESLADNFTQGINPHTQRVICSRPTEFLNKRKDVPTEKLIDVFTPEFNQYLVKVTGNCKISNIKYDYVFLTQPFHDYINEYERLLKLHETLLPQIFDILRKRGKTVIKLHPREQFDYSQFSGNGVDLPGGFIQQLPFECLMQAYGNPQMISMFSSSCINIETEKPSIFLGELFEIPGATDLFDEGFYHANNIIPCKTIEDFENAIAL